MPSRQTGFAVWNLCEIWIYYSNIQNYVLFKLSKCPVCDVFQYILWIFLCFVYAFNSFKRLVPFVIRLIFSIHIHFGLDDSFVLDSFVIVCAIPALISSWFNHVIIQLLLWFSDRSNVSDFLPKRCEKNSETKIVKQRCECPLVEVDVKSMNRVRGSWSDPWSKPSWWADRRFGCDGMWSDRSPDMDVWMFGETWWNITSSSLIHQHHFVMWRPAPDPPDVRGAYRTISPGRGWDPCTLISIWRIHLECFMAHKIKRGSLLFFSFIKFISNWGLDWCLV